MFLKSWVFGCFFFPTFPYRGHYLLWMNLSKEGGNPRAGSSPRFELGMFRDPPHARCPHLFVLGLTDHCSKSWARLALSSSWACAGGVLGESHLMHPEIQDQGRMSRTSCFYTAISNSFSTVHLGLRWVYGMSSVETWFGSVLLTWAGLLIFLSLTFSKTSAWDFSLGLHIFLRSWGGLGRI